MAPDTTTHLARTVLDLIESDHPQDAVPCLRTLSQEGTERRPHWHLVLDLLGAGLVAESRLAFEHAITEEPGHSTTCVRLARRLWQELRVGEAVALLQRSTARDPENGEALALLGIMLVALNLVPQGIARLQKAAERWPQDVEVHFRLGLALCQEQRWDEAEDACLRAVKAAPHDGRFLPLLALATWMQGRRQQAVSLLAATAGAFTGPAQAVGSCLGRPPSTRVSERPPRQSALVRLLRTLAVRPQDGRAHADLGSCLSQMGMHRAAEALVARATELLRQNRPAEVGRTRARFSSGAQTTSRTERIRELPPNSLVVFVADDPRVRQAKMAHGLRAAGWGVVLLHKRDPNFDVARFFDAAVRYRNDEEALEIANRYSPLVYHVCSVWADTTSAFLIRHKPGKVVYDCWDFVDGIADATWQVPLQRFCLENADALCCRDLRPRYLSRALGYNLPTKRILFQEYCWDATEVSTQDHSFVGDGIHTVVCGNIGIEKHGQADTGYLRIAASLADQGVHLHIYPHPSQVPFEDLFSDYLALAGQTRFVHIHPPLPMERVVPELARYDVGISLTHALTFGTRLKDYSAAYLRYCGSARIFDYVDAGLPVVLNRALAFQYSLLARHGVAIDGSDRVLKNARRELENLCTPETRRRVQRFRSTYSVARQTSRLIDFYASV